MAEGLEGETTELVKELKKIVKSLKEAKKTASVGEASFLLSEVEKIKQEAEAQKAELKARVEELDALANEVKASEDAAEAAGQEFLEQQLEQRRKAIETQAKKVREQKKEIADQEKKFDERENKAKLKAFEKTTKDFEKKKEQARRKARRRAQKHNDDLVRLIKMGADKGSAVVKDFAAEVSAPLATLAFLRPDLGALPVLKSLQDEFTGFDSTFRSVIKQTGQFSGRFRRVFIDSLAPAGKIDNVLQDIGASAKDAAEAAKSLFPVSEVFRTLSMRGDRAAKSVLGQTIAFKKLNIPTAETAKSFDILTKALGLNAKQSITSNKRILGVANSLNMELGKAFKDFTGILPDIMMFGDDTVEVFGKLEAQANATGLAVNQLSKFAQKMDTFKGASEVAARFNAQLGGMFVSGIDLAQADFPEKIGMIQKAFQNAGKTFDDLGRRDRQALAASLGLSVEETARLLNNAESVEGSLKKLDTSVMTDKQQRAKIQETMNQQELLTKSNARFMQGIASFTQKTRQISTTAGNAITKSFKNANKSVRGSNEELATALGTLVAIKGVTAIGGAIPKAFSSAFALRGTRAAILAGGGAYAGAVTFADLNKLTDSEADQQLAEEIDEAKADLEDPKASRKKKTAARNKLRRIKKKLDKLPTPKFTADGDAGDQSIAALDVRTQALQSLTGTGAAEKLFTSELLAKLGADNIDLGGAGIDTAFEKRFIEELIKGIDNIRDKDEKEKQFNILVNLDGEEISKSTQLLSGVKEAIAGEFSL